MPVSGAEVPAAEIAVSPAMMDAARRAVIRHGISYEAIYREMERVRRAEAHTIPPPGYRNASEDEPERNAGPRCAHGVHVLLDPPCSICVAEVEAFRQKTAEPPHD